MNNYFTDDQTNQELNNFYNNFKNKQLSLQQLFNQDKDRVNTFSTEDHNIFLDYSKNWIDQKSLNLLIKIAEQNNLTNKIEQLFNGTKINISENRAALHTALRDCEHINFNKLDLIKHNTKPDSIYQQIIYSHKIIKNLYDQINNKSLLGFSGEPINTIVNIGIGGSDLGPKMVYRALTNYHNKTKCYFVSNIDPNDITQILNKVNIATTLFIVSSKSFTTTETLNNANKAKHSLLKQCSIPDLAKHFVAITSKPESAIDFGIDKNNILPMWDWVGGRYSLWSSIGISIALGTSYQYYLELLKGAHDIDNHFKTKPLNNNIPVLLGLLGIGYINYADCQSHAILPYSNNLEYFTNYIQQLDMESNGKTVNNHHNFINYKTSPVIWGSVGTNGQHAFHQLFHQGAHTIPCDFIVPIKNQFDEQQQKILVANAFAQAKTLMDGYEPENTANYKYLAGNKPSNMILIPELTPYYLGALIAIYEHKTYVQGCIWNVNSFDQWGVERGKVIANEILPHLDYNCSNKDIVLYDLDSSTQKLIKKFHDYNAI